MEGLLRDQRQVSPFISLTRKLLLVIEERAAHRPKQTLAPVEP